MSKRLASQQAVLWLHACLGPCAGLGEQGLHPTRPFSLQGLGSWTCLVPLTCSSLRSGELSLLHLSTDDTAVFFLSPPSTFLHLRRPTHRSPLGPNVHVESQGAEVGRTYGKASLPKATPFQEAVY